MLLAGIDRSNFRTTNDAYKTPAMTAIALKHSMKPKNMPIFKKESNKENID